MFKKLFLGNTKVNFYDKASLLYKIFVIEIIVFVTILVLALTNVLNLNLSVDFTGGTTYQLDTKYNTEDINDVMNNKILEVSRYQNFENSNTIIFRATEATSDKEAEFLNYLSFR